MRFCLIEEREKRIANSEMISQSLEMIVSSMVKSNERQSIIDNDGEENKVSFYRRASRSYFPEDYLKKKMSLVFVDVQLA